MTLVFITEIGHIQASECLYFYLLLQMFLYCDYKNDLKPVPTS